MHKELEIEVKLARDDITFLKRAGLDLKEHKARHFEDNWLLDTADQRLVGQGAALRVRRVGERGTVTYKGVALETAASPLKVREEIESGIDDPGRVIELFERLGFSRSFRYQKYRTTYTASVNGADLEIAFDETPIGNFVEIEGDEPHVLQVLQQAGISEDESIRESYPELQAKRCRDKGLPVEDLVF
jgi:adenylate cyclase class 2